MDTVKALEQLEERITDLTAEQAQQQKALEEIAACLGDLRVDLGTRVNDAYEMAIAVLGSK